MKKHKSFFAPPEFQFEVGDIVKVISQPRNAVHQKKWMWTRYLHEPEDEGVTVTTADLSDLPVMVESGTVCLVAEVRDGETITDTWYYVITPTGNLWTTGGGLEKID